MLRISKMADYAVVSLLELCTHDSSELHTTRAIAERSRLPQSTVSKIMKLLQNSSLVESQRGLCGGYRLLKSPDEITLLEIIEAIDGSVALTTCSLPESIDCQSHTHCNAGAHWPIINQAIVGVLKGIVLSSLVSSPKSAEVLHGATLSLGSRNCDNV